MEISVKSRIMPKRQQELDKAFHLHGPTTLLISSMKLLMMWYHLLECYLLMVSGKYLNICFKKSATDLAWEISVLSKSDLKVQKVFWSWIPHYTIIRLNFVHQWLNLNAMMKELKTIWIYSIGTNTKLGSWTVKWSYCCELYRSKMTFSWDYKKNILQTFQRWHSKIAVFSNKWMKIWTMILIIWSQQIKLSLHF